MTLADLKPGEKGIVVKVKGYGAFRKRIIEMGFISGKEVAVIQRAPLNDPTEYKLMGYNITLRSSEAKLIEIIQEAISQNTLQKSNLGSLTSSELKKNLQHKSKTINIAFVGNPNSGKTTIFNYSSGAHEKVGNYSGVTVNAKEAKFKKGEYRFIATDLPGTYSITAYSPEEIYVRDFIINSAPDVVVNIIDSSNLERNLYLTTQLIDMDIKVVGVLNMYDEFEKSGNKLNYDKLGKLLGIPFVPCIGSKGIGIKDLLDKIINVYEDNDATYRHIHINYGEIIETSLSKIINAISKPYNNYFSDKLSKRFAAIKLIENDSIINSSVQNLVNSAEIERTVQKEITKIETNSSSDAENLISDIKYAFIAGALHETLEVSSAKLHNKSDFIDKILTHKNWGIPIFLALLYFTFYCTFTIGQYPMDWIDNLVGFFSTKIDSLLNEGILKDLIINGIIGGVGGVIVFLPNILILYLFISLMEDSGYMARAVFIADRAMHKIGLHGKSFIPLIMGFGCNVPAILATKIIESKRDRLITMLIIPFMSCSARLPVYILFISAFFAKYQALILFSFYLLGIILAILTTILIKKIFLKKSDTPFVMELPPYRIPTIRTISLHVWRRIGQYLKKIGGVILVASIIIWALSYFPISKENNINENKIKSIENENYNFANKSNINPLKQIKTDSLRQKTETLRQENSYIGQIGHFIEPIMKPLGLDWKMSVALLTGVAAKEIIIGTMGVLYQVDKKSTDSSQSLINKLQQQTYKSNEINNNAAYSPLVALSFIIFILVYFPCVGVIAAISRESGSWKWAAFVVVYTTTLAYILSLLTFQIGNLIIN